MNEPDRLVFIRQLLRPLNLILIHQGVWPLLVLMFNGPRVTDPAAIPWDWWGVRVATAALAAGLALLFMRREHPGTAESWRLLPGGGSASLRTQVAFALLVLPFMVALARFAIDPEAATTKIILFGAVDALAYQAISFGVAKPIFSRFGWGNAAAIGSLALSWGLRDLILAIVGSTLSSPLFTLVGGAITGLLIGLASIGLRRWPGGFWIAWSVQWLVVSLIIGFS